MTGATLTEKPRVLARTRVIPTTAPVTVILSFVVVLIVLAWSLAPGLFAQQDPTKGDPGRQVPAAEPGPSASAPTSWDATSSRAWCSERSPRSPARSSPS